MSNYLIEINDYTLKEIEVNKIIKKEGFNDALTSSYDLEDASFSSVLEDLDTYGFLSNKKVIIVSNAHLFDIEKNKDHFDHLIRYFDSPDPDKLLIFISSNFNHTTKLYKELSKRCSLIKEDISSKAFIKHCFEGYSIDQNTINLLDEYCLSDFTKIQSECEKLKSYKIDDKKILKEDVLELVSKKLGDPREITFAFSRSIGLRDREDALKKYQELLNYQIEPLSIIGLLASQIRIIYQVKLLISKHLSDKEIGDMLGEKEFRIKKTRELVPYYSEEDCLNIMKKLSDIDYRIKTTDTNSNQEIELFIINL